MRDSSPTRAPAPHALTFRVMRLTTPLPPRTPPLPLHPYPVSAPPIWEAEGAACGVGSLTVLPSSFGSIYASETFRSFISVFNRGRDAVDDVSVNIVMQTSSQLRIPLHETPNPRKLESRASMNNVVTVALPELGVHVLVCTATYTDKTATRTLRQFFRFNVLPPLEPSLTVRPLYTGLDATPTRVTTRFVHYLVDLRLLNAVPVPVYVTKATFVPKEPFLARALSRDNVNAPEDEVENGIITGGRQASMGLSDARNFIFHVYRAFALDEAERQRDIGTQSGEPSLVRTDRASPTTSPVAPSPSERPQSYRTERASNDRPERQLGHMTISWRSAHGEIGHLDNVVMASEPIHTMPEIEVSIYAVPASIRTHQPFVARCAARNNKPHAVRLYLQVRRDLVGEIVPMGVSGVSLGEVLPGRTARCTTTWIPLLRGTHSISGLRVVDIDSKVSYKAEPPTVTVS